MENWIRSAGIIPGSAIANLDMDDQPHPLPPSPGETAEKKLLWPWILLQFVPTVVISICVLLGAPDLSRLLSSWQTVSVLAYLYCYLVLFFFFRSRGKTVSNSLIFAIGAAWVAFVANIVLVLGIVFVGCLVLLGAGVATGGKF